MLPYDTAAYLYSTESVLKYLQDFTAHPMAMLIPDIKAANPLFHQLLSLIPFAPSLATKLQQILMDNLLHYL